MIRFKLFGFETSLNFQRGDVSKETNISNCGLMIRGRQNARRTPYIPGLNLISQYLAAFPNVIILKFQLWGARHQLILIPKFAGKTTWSGARRWPHVFLDFGPFVPRFTMFLCFFLPIVFKTPFFVSVEQC